MAHANMVLDWYQSEFLPSEDIPPRWMWHLDHELTSWFDQVKARKGGSGADAVMDRNEDPLVERLRSQTGRR